MALAEPDASAIGLVALGQRALDAERRDATALEDFAVRLVDTPLHVLMSHVDPNSGRAGFAMLAFEATDLPGLVAHVALPDGQAAPEGFAWVTLRGEHLLALGQQMRFVFVIADAEHTCTVMPDQQASLLDLAHSIRVQHAPGANPPAVSDAQAEAAIREVPTAFNRAVYDYAAAQAGVRRLWLAVVVSAIGVGRPPMRAVVDARPSEFDQHVAALHALAEAHLPPGQVLMVGAHGDGGPHAAIAQAEPFYSDTHDRGLFARLKRWVSPPPIVLLRINLTD